MPACCPAPGTGNAEMAQDPEKKFFATAISRWFFGISTLLMLYLGYLLIQPFLMPIFLAVVLVVVGWPLHMGVLRLVGPKRQHLAAAVTVFVFTVIIVMPLYFIVGIISEQALGLYNTVSNMVQGAGCKSPSSTAWTCSTPSSTSSTKPWASARPRCSPRWASWCAG